MKESNPRTIRERIDSMFGEQPAPGATAGRRSMLKAAWERLTPAEEWASQRRFNANFGRHRAV